jgi:MFS family permease
VVIGLTSLALFFLPTQAPLSYVLTFIFGLFAFTLYPLSSALANSRVDDEHRVGVSSALLVAFGLGASIGSALLAQVMTFFGHHALYASFAVLTVIMYSLLTYINARQKAEKPEPSDYVASPSDITNSPLAATLDPRIEEKTAHEQMLIVDGHIINTDIFNEQSDDETENQQPKDEVEEKERV